MRSLPSISVLENGKFNPYDSSKKEYPDYFNIMPSVTGFSEDKDGTKETFTE